MDSCDDRRELELADVLKELTETPPSQRPTLQAVTARHPRLAEELRSLWGTVLLVDAIADQSLQPTLSPAPTDHLPVGRPPQVIGDFELIEELGRGGMGVVYRARQKRLNREVALKLITHGAHASESDQVRFRAEAIAAASLEHTNIVPIYEVGEAAGWQYIAMQLVEGETLATLVSAGPMLEAKAVRLVYQIALAIDYAHSRGVIHRDLKPANILIDATGNPYVTDFGLAKHITAGLSLTQSGAILGTPSYMSPEQAAGSRGKVGPPSDVYSLGAILYALLTGRPPYQGTSPVDTVLMVLEQNPLPPRILNRRVSRDLEMIVLKCLQKPVDLRYASASALANDLRAYLAGESVSARSGRLSDVVARIFRETHNATVLENWGVLWMWHAVVLLFLCVVTNVFHLAREHWPVMNQPWPYVGLWGGGLAVWAPTFWALRHRAGPVTAVERQIAHAWAGSIVSVILLFWIESLLGLPVLTLSPVLGLISGMVFVMKGGILAGEFYVHASALFGVSIVMALMQHNGNEYGLTVYGLVSAATFFLPGWKYHRQNRLHAIVQSEASTTDVEM